MPEALSDTGPARYGEDVAWQPAKLRLSLVRFVLGWIFAAAAVAVSIWIAPGASIDGPAGAFLVAAVIGDPQRGAAAGARGAAAAVHARHRASCSSSLADAAGAHARRRAAARRRPRRRLRRRAARLAADGGRHDRAPGHARAPTTTTSTRCASRGGSRAARARTRRTDAPGIIFLEIDGLALPVLRAAMRDGSAPNMARWVADDGYRLTEWETDLSSQTGASQAGILLGSNENIPAFRWVEKETGRMMACSAPADCAEIERRHATGIGLLDRRRRQPRQPALGRGRRGDPHGQPHRGREARPTPATARSSRTASTSRGRSSCSSGRSCSS